VTTFLERISISVTFLMLRPMLLENLKVDFHNTMKTYGEWRCRSTYHSKTCLKRNLKGPEHFSAEVRFPFNQCIL
jgi:hypothetical protein